MSFLFPPAFGPPGFSQFPPAGPFPGPGFFPPGIPGPEPPKIFYGRDPAIHGNTVYKYKKLSGDNGPPLMGMPPALFVQAQQAMTAPPFPMSTPACPFGMPGGFPSVPGAMPAGPIPPCATTTQAQGDLCIVRFFEDNVVNLYKRSDRVIFEVPMQKHKIEERRVPRNTRIKDIIRDIECSSRANYYLEPPEEYPKEHIGIQELEHVGGNKYQALSKIMLKDPTKKARRTLADIFGADRREILVVRLPVSATEITATADLVRSAWPDKTDLSFKVITLDEPPKKEIIPFLEAEHSGSALPHIDRKAFVAYYIRNTDRFHEAVVNLTKHTVERNVRLGPNVHGNGDYDEVFRIEKVALEDPGVKDAIAKLQLPDGTVVCADPWIYGSDGIGDDDRMWQVFMYMRDPANPSEVDSNHYAFPIPISPVVRASTYEVVRIDIMPTGADHTIRPVKPYTPKPANEYLSEYQNLRTDLKPLQVVQPEGASFKVTPVGESGQVIDWQKWSFRFGYNQREGMVLYDVRYESRPLFYRLSLSDMNIPYADPRHPFHKKAAFDLGDAGAGAMANNLKLGCDCLGNIHYLSAVIASEYGTPIPLENCVCVHEQDAGIGWKHTNYRTGRAALVRSRELVLQTIMTVSNYEYILAFMFNQAGELHYEVRATGILSTQPIDHEFDQIGVPFGTIVHPGVLAAHHQHIFSLRIDPMIDGQTNTLTYDEAYAMPLDEETNPHGTGYYNKSTQVTHSTGLDLDPDTNRTFKITNPNSLNKINSKAVAYKIVAPPFQKMLAHPSSFHHKRAEFADHNIYVTKHHDRELYAGGWYTNQSRGGDGVRTWANRNDPLLPATTTDEYPDIVLWVQFGMNHIPRIEDFPVMPCEVLRVSLKPVNFFDKNPALDVPPSEQWFNQSTLVSEMHRQPAAEAVITNGRPNGVTNGACCGNAESANGH